MEKTKKDVDDMFQRIIEAEKSLLDCRDAFDEWVYFGFGFHTGERSEIDSPGFPGVVVGEANPDLPMINGKPVDPEGLLNILSHCNEIIEDEVICGSFGGMACVPSLVLSFL